MKLHSRSGFTLLELMILLALMTFAIGVMLPLLQMLRLAAARQASRNKLKQLVFACWAHHDDHGAFPFGVAKNGFSAMSQLLPYLHEGNLYKQIDFNSLATAKANEPVRATVLSKIISPLDPLGKIRPDNIAPTSYLFSAGTKFSVSNNNGVVFENSKVRIVDITDGASTTIIIGETLIGDGGKQGKDVKRQHVKLDEAALKNLNDDSGIMEFAGKKNVAGDRCHSWLEGRFLQGTFTGTRKINDERPDVDCGGAGGLSALRGLHKGVHVAFCDGRVLFISESISFATWQALCTRNGGEDVQPNPFK